MSTSVGPSSDESVSTLYNEGGDAQQDEVEDAAAVEVEEYYPVEYSISSYGADYPVDGLVKRIGAGSIFIPSFQRGYVWNTYRASRFIESLLLGLPVPAIFLSREEGSQKLLVIDGQQRLRTLQYFYDGLFVPTGSAFKLRQVQAQFEGLTYKTLRAEDRLRLDDSIIHAIIVKQEKPLDEDPTSIYHIFERLNTGGILLQPQEIRSCIYHGAFSDLLAELNDDQNWRRLFGKVSTRMRDQELILRVFALLYASDSYTKPMKEFLNRFMSKNRNVRTTFATELRTRFIRTTSEIREKLGERVFKPTRAVNAALCDALMVAIAKRLEHGPITDASALEARYRGLLNSQEFMSTIIAATTDEGSVETRLRLATGTFSGVP